MEENEITHHAAVERKSASNWYRWLWFSPLLTIPTLLVLYIVIDIYIWSQFNSDWWWIGQLFSWSGAILGSALWHLLLLKPARNKESAFLRWHGRQAMILAGVRTAVPLISFLVIGSSGGALFSILILIPIWLFGTSWGQRQATRGDCSLMRWTGREADLPGPQVESELTQDFSPETLVNIIRFNKDPEKRQVALDELKKHGMVESL